MATRIDTVPNRPTAKPVLDYRIGAGIARVVLQTVSSDDQNLVLTGWAFLIDESGSPVLDPATAAPIATTDSTRTVHLSGVMAGTHSIHDDWCRYCPPGGKTIDADNLPEGWTTGHGAPTGTAEIGTGYYDLDSGLGYTFNQGCLDQVGTSFADALQGQIDAASKLAKLGF